MRRREFIALLGSVSAAWPSAARAQQSAGHISRVSYLSISSAKYDVSNLAAFRDGLQRLGYIEGRTVDIDYRYSDGDTNALAALAQQLVQLKPNVALANAISPTRALKRVAPTLPIVCPAFGDSFVPSLAASFAHPGGSVTGVASVVEGLLGKLTELIIDAIPGTKNIGFLANPSGASTPEAERQIRSVAQERGIQVRIEEVTKPEDIAGALQRLSDEKVQAIIVPGNGLLNSELKQIVELALALRLPLVFGQRYGVEAGGFASYGVNPSDNFRRAATYIDKILKGTIPGDLPIEFPTKIELAVNLKTAKLLGLTVPSSLVDRADVVID
jgi:putative ABC transport system substrate-binding protein